MKNSLIRGSWQKLTQTTSVLLLLALSPLPALAQAPTNDDFANATILSGTNIVETGTTLNATAEPGEPDHCGYPPSHSIWYDWTAPANGSVLIDLTGSTPGSDVSVYVGKYLTTLTSIAANADGNSDQTGRCIFSVTGGIVYEVAVDVTSGSGGPVQMHLIFTNSVFPPIITEQPADQSVVQGGNAIFSVVATGVPAPTYQWLFQGVDVASATNSTLVLTNIASNQGGAYEVIVSNPGGSTNSQPATLTVIPRPANDDFSNRIQLIGTNLTTTGSDTYATLEPGEPDGGWSGAQSVWWTWTAPTNGIANLDVSDFTGDQVLSVYTGDILTNLTLVTSATWFNLPLSVQFPVAAGVTFQIAVDGVLSSGGNFQLSLNFMATNFPPVITNQPTNVTVLQGGSATFAVGVSSALPCAFQWLLDNTVIPGATNSALVLNTDILAII
jgi:hypothetical protein